MGDARRLPQTSARRGIGWIVAGSLAIGLVTALVLVAAPFIEAKENAAFQTTQLADGPFELGWQRGPCWRTGLARQLRRGVAVLRRR
jgi:hypothetical protein